MIEISFLANGRCERKARQVKARRAQDKARYDISDQASGAEGSANTCTYRKLGNNFGRVHIVEVFGKTQQLLGMVRCKRNEYETIMS